jgi:hypothetical protein
LDWRTVSDSFGPVNDLTSSNPGRWLELGIMDIVRTPNQNNTWLALSFEVTGPSATSQDVEVHAVVFDPISDVETDAIGEVGA